MNEPTYSVGATYVVVGERDIRVLCQSLQLLRSFQPDLPVTIYHDIAPDRIPLGDIPGITLKQFQRINYPEREENRNSSFWRLVSLKESPYDITLYLDNDIFIVHPGFFEGFRISSGYGMCMVQNPRMFIKTYEGNIGDLDRGADVLSYDKEYCKEMPFYMNSYNMGVMFYNRHHHNSAAFLDNLLWEQENNPSRGQAGLYRTIWKTKMFPYCLPINWLVCRKHCGIENPLSLHAGHPNILEWWKRRFEK